MTAKQQQNTLLFALCVVFAMMYSEMHMETLILEKVTVWISHEPTLQLRR